MTESKHTPGPWRFEPIGRPLDGGWVIVAGDAEWVARGENPQLYDRDFRTDAANAALIAAAPELLEALEAMLYRICTHRPGDEWQCRQHAQQHAALRKAKGE